MKRGQKALFAFKQESAANWIVIPFLAPVPNVSMGQLRGGHDAFECTGPLVDCDAFRDIEFFVSPLDLRWSFVRTHEDFELGGPYFVRSEWLSS